MKRIQEGNTELVAAISDIIQPVATIKKSKGRLDGKDEGVASRFVGMSMFMQIVARVD